MIAEMVAKMGCMVDYSINHIWDIIVAVVTLCAFIFSIYLYLHGRWSASREFLENVDSDEMRTARKKVYDYIYAGGNIEEIGNNCEKDVEMALTKVIAFYDGSAVLILNGYIPECFFDNTTLQTAADFYDKVSPYILKRRTDTERLDYNRVYAHNYTKLMSKSCTKRKMNKIIKMVGSDSYKEEFRVTQEFFRKKCDELKQM